MGLNKHKQWEQLEDGAIVPKCHPTVNSSHPHVLRMMLGITETTVPFLYININNINLYNLHSFNTSILFMCLHYCLHFKEKSHLNIILNVLHWLNVKSWRCLLHLTGVALSSQCIIKTVMPTHSSSSVPSCSLSLDHVWRFLWPLDFQTWSPRLRK